MTRFAPRPGRNTDGKPIKVQLNIFQVQRLPRGDIYQYDVSLSLSGQSRHSTYRSRSLYLPIQRIAELWSRRSGAHVEYRVSLRRPAENGCATAINSHGELIGVLTFDIHFDLQLWTRSSQKLPRGEERITVDLDAEAGKTTTSDRQSNYYCVIKQTKVLHMEYLTSYLQKKVSWDATVLECMSKFGVAVLLNSN